MSHAPLSSIITFSSTKENGRDTLIYTAKLIDSDTTISADSIGKLELQSKLVTPIPSLDGPTVHWVAQDISLDDRYILITLMESSNYRPLYIIDTLAPALSSPKEIRFPGATEPESEIVHRSPRFSRDPSTPDLLYVLTSAFGDFYSVVAYDLKTETVTHITTPDPGLPSLRPVPWDFMPPRVTSEGVFFRSNEAGWQVLYALVVHGVNSGKVVEVRIEGWEGGILAEQTNERNGKPWELALQLVSHRTKGSIVHLDLASALESEVHTDVNGNPYIIVSVSPYVQAAAHRPAFRTMGPKLLSYDSFDGLKVPAMYYHPDDGKSVVPVVIYIHGGPEGQSTSQPRSYVLVLIIFVVAHGIPGPSTGICLTRWDAP